jgi:hypothetical protein
LIAAGKPSDHSAGLLGGRRVASRAAIAGTGGFTRTRKRGRGTGAGVLYLGWVATPLVNVVRGQDPTTTAFKERLFPGRLGAFMDPDDVATAIPDGIEARAARIIRPKLWRPVSALRGVFNNVSDALLRHDTATLAYIDQIDANARNKSTGQ